MNRTVSTLKAPICAAAVSRTHSTLMDSDVMVSMDLCHMTFINTLVDLDECQVGLNGDTTCDEVCVNTIGSYTCGCNPGRVLVSNGVSCRGMLIGIILEMTFHHPHTCTPTT